MKFENIFGRSKSEENKPVEYFTFKQDLIDKPLDSLSQEELIKLRNDLAEQYQKGINTEQIAAVDKKIADINILTGSDTKPKTVEIPSWDPKSEKSQKDHERDEILKKELAIEEEPKEELSHEEKMVRLNETLAPEPQENPAETLSDEDRIKKLNENLAFEPVGNPTENLSDSERVEKVDEILNNKPEGEPASAEAVPAAEEEKDPEFWNKNKIIDAPEENEGESSKVETPPAEENVPEEQLESAPESSVAIVKAKKHEISKPSVAVVKSEGPKIIEREPITAEPIPLEDLEPEIKEAEIEKDQKEIEAEIEKMTPEEKEKVGAAFRNIGFKAKEWSHATIASLLDKFSKNTEENSTVSRFLLSSKKKFEESRDNAKKAAKGGYDKEGHYIIKNSASLVTTCVRLGRIITDITGRTAAAPLRYFMMGGKIAGGTADILKETRLSNTEVIEKTRLNNKEKAEDEAWSLYEQALSKKSVEKSGEDDLEEEKVVSAEDLKQTYLENMPKDLVERLSKEPDEALNFVQRMVKADLGGAINKLNKKIEKIEGDKNLDDKEKEEKKAILLRKQERNLHDYDRMLSQYGTVDGLAMLGRYGKAASNAVVYATTAQTYGMIIENIWGHVADMISHSDFIHHSTENVSNLASEAMDKTRGLFGSHVEAAEGVVPPEINGLEGGHIPLPENMEIIEKGGSVVHSAEDMIRHGQITQEQFDAAWHNPDSIVSIHGEPMHISHAALVHEGNGIRFVAGENGGAPRFEVVEADGPEIGSDQDLLARYHELGKKPPEWLEKAVHAGTGGHHDLAPDGHEVPAPDHDAAGDNVAANTDKIPNYSDHYSEAGDYNTALEKAGYTTDYEPHLASAVTGSGVQHFEGAGDITSKTVENLSPESIAEVNYWVEYTDHTFNDLPLSEQEGVINGLTGVHEHLEKLLENGQTLTDESRLEAIETQSMIEHMRQTLLETEQAFKDKLYGFGFKKAGEYERIFGGKKVSVKSLLNEAEKTHDDRFEKLAKFINGLKPSRKEQLLDVTGFLKSRFR